MIFKSKTKATALSLTLFLFFQISLGNASVLTDVNYKFDQTKVNASADSFHFMRSFVDYYYDLIANNSNSLNVVKNLGAYAGWCVGDAHAENFGILLQENGSALFSMNDMDDSGPCPVAYDLFRILVSSRLYMPSLDSQDTQDIIKSYTDGLNGVNASVPESIKSMTSDSLNKGKQIEAKDLQGKTLKRKASMSEVDSATKAQITTLLQGQYRSEGLNVLDIVATSKVGGGSGGLLRYEVLITNSKKEMIHLELKELVAPAVAVVATAIIPDQAERMQKSLQIDQGTGFSHYYNVFTISGKTMLLRPKFSGNQSINLADSSEQDNKIIINFEAYILGRLHANSVNVQEYRNGLSKMSAESWEEDISAMSLVFTKRFNELKK